MKKSGKKTITKSVISKPRSSVKKMLKNAGDEAEQKLGAAEAKVDVVGELITTAVEAGSKKLAELGTQKLKKLAKKVEHKIAHKIGL